MNLPTLLVLAGLLPPASAAGLPWVHYRITYAPERSSTTWEITAVLDQLEGAGDVSVDRPSWGEAEKLGRAYMDGLTADGAQVPGDEKGWRVIRPKGATGPLTLRYRLTLQPWPKDENGNLPVLPFCGDTYCNGFAENTLIRVRRKGRSMSAKRSLSFALPDGWKPFTGWGRPDGSGAVVLDSDYHNGVITFGAGERATTIRAGGIDYEVIQHGLASDVTPTLAAYTAKVYGHFAGAMGVSSGGPVRISVTGTHGWGTNTEHGIHLSVSNEDSLHTPDKRSHLAHELFHDWLGNLLHEEGGRSDMTWFQEGFTDYMAKRSLVQLGLADASWFAKQVVKKDREVRGNPANAAAALGLSDSAWRRFDTDLEELAYAKGFLAAFHIDRLLRRSGRASVADLLRDHLAGRERRYSQASVQGWLRAHGLADFVERHILQPDLPELDPALRELGFAPAEEQVPLGYIGLRIERTEAGKLVRSVDPEGPAGRAGVRVGDHLKGYTSGRADVVRVSESVATPYRFGLEVFDPGREYSFHFIRGEEHLRLSLAPAPLAGGLATLYRPASKNELERFFAK